MTSLDSVNVIEQVSVENISEVMQVNQACLPENYPRHYFIHILKSFPKCFLVAKYQETIIGYIMCKIQQSRFTSKLPFFKRGPIGHIISIAVLEEHRNKRIGAQILKQSLWTASEYYAAKEYMLEVRITNPAVSFYERLGFKIDKELRSYYNDGENGYLMVRKPFTPSEIAFPPHNKID